jgi:hypothetical protein
MTKTPYRLADIGEELHWTDLRDFVTYLPQESALFRQRHPQSYWWTADHDFFAALIAAVQWGNWQRGGGKGDKPKVIERPVDKPKTVAGPKSAAELHARKQALKQTMERMSSGD